MIRRLRRPPSDLQRALLAQLAERGVVRSDRLAGPAARFVIVDALRRLVRAGLVERHELDADERRGSRRYAYTVTDGGRALLTPPDRADG